MIINQNGGIFYPSVHWRRLVKIDSGWKGREGENDLHKYSSTSVNESGSVYGRENHQKDRCHLMSLLATTPWKKELKTG